jgi:long-chain acyl-CoA synthetase
MNVAHLLEWSARRHRDRPALVCGGQALSFGEVHDRAARLASALQQLGIAKGDRVAILIGNRPEYLEAEFAVAIAGAVRVPMLVTLTPSEMVAYLRHADVAAVIVSSDAAATLRTALPQVERAVAVIVIGAGDQGEHPYEDLIEGSTATHGPDLDDADLYAIRFTGGTTGTPKAVTMRHRSMVNVINNMLLNWPITGEDVVLSVHPLSHASGMLSYPYWVAGAKNVIRPAFGFEPEPFLRDVEHHRVTAVFLIPTVLNVLLDSPALDSCDHSSLRNIIYGGAPIPLERLRQALDRFGQVFIQVYGTSEAPMLLTTLMPEDHAIGGDEIPQRLRSAGREALNVEVRIVRSDGSGADIGEVGEVISRGAHTMDGYWRNEQLTNERLRDGWVHTGDMGRVDEHGYLYIVDRKEDMIISGGFNVWPAEIEDVVYQHPRVREAAVFGIEHDRWGEAVASVVVARPGERLEEAELLAFLRERLAPYKVPKGVVFRTAPLPTSGVGKLLRRKVREEHADELRRLIG